MPYQVSGAKPKSRRTPPSQPTRRTALVTGASSGIGESTVMRLAGDGWTVLAGVRSPADFDRIAEITGVRPVRLDVTSAEAIDQTRELVDDLGGGRLDALINNAGVCTLAPIETLPLASWREHFEVNVIGQVGVTQAMLPALVNARGRIVNISSISGLVALPAFGSYAASKYALEAVTDALRREIRSSGVRVIALEPGAIVTPIWERWLRRYDELSAEMTVAEHHRYDRMYESVRRFAKRASETGLSSSAVADLVAAVIVSKHPKTRYRLGKDARLFAALDRLPPFLADAIFAQLLNA